MDDKEETAMDSKYEQEIDSLFHMWKDMMVRVNQYRKRSYRFMQDAYEKNHMDLLNPMSFKENYPKDAHPVAKSNYIVKILLKCAQDQKIAVRLPRKLIEDRDELLKYQVDLNDLFQDYDKKFDVLEQELGVEALQRAIEEHG